MALTITAQIEAALATGSINYIDLVRIKLSRTEFLYWSSAAVPERLNAEGIVYDPRIVSMSPLPFTAGFQDTSISMSFDNTDGYVKNKINQGILWHEAEVAVSRLFPDLALEYNQIGSWASPYWWGWVSQAPTFEELSSMKISAGFSELTRPALRRLGRTDETVFGSEHFPYDPMTGKGLPQNKVSGTATGGDATTLTTAATLTDIKEGWLVFIKTKKIIGRVVTAAAGVITVENWVYGGDEATAVIPANADLFICGPVYTEFDGNQSTCLNMGMFGPNKQQTDNDLNTDMRRYFTGITIPGNSYLQPGASAAIGSLANQLFSSVQGEGSDGTAIPVYVGKFQADLIPFAWGVADKYVHILGVIGEGRIGYAAEPYLDGIYPTDNIDLSSQTYDDSWIVGGVQNPDPDDSTTGNDFDAIATGELTESQQMQAIGSREAYAKWRKASLDTYKNNPWKFNASDGSGNALGCLAWVRARFEKEGYDARGVPVVKNRGTGIEVLCADDTWTQSPTPIDVFYWFFRNQLWGGGLAVERLDKTAITAESVKAATVISSGGTNPRVVTGALVAGPQDMTCDLDLPLSVVVVPADAVPQGSTVNYKQITIEAGSDSYTFNITRNWPVPDTLHFLTPENKVVHATVGDTGLFLALDQFFDGEIPAAGDTFYLQMENSSTVGGNMKYAANGSLSRDCRVGEMAEDILKNCNATYTQKNGKIVPIIRAAVDQADITSKRVFSDWGANRNVVMSNGKSTFKFVPALAKDIPTSVRVEYVDIDQRYQKRQITIRNLFAEKRVKELTGQDVRNRKAVILPLNLTGSIDQAVLLGTLYMREHSFIEEVPNYHPGEYSLQVPIHVAQDVVPVEDVYRIAGKAFPDWCRFMRITSKMDDYSKGVVTLKGMPYLEEMYRFTQNDFLIVPGPIITDQPGNMMPPLVIQSLVETGFRDDDGVFYVEIEGELTLPA